MVPDGWQQKHLSDVSTKISDGIHSTPEYVDESDIFFINGNNLKNGKIVITENTKCVSNNELEKHGRELGDRTILMSINGTIGNLAYYHGEKVILGKSAAYINLNAKVNKDYIYYALDSSKTKSYFQSELTGTTIRNLSLKSIKSTKVAIPPLTEQNIIANILSTWDKAIETVEKLIENSRAQKKALMQQLLTGKNRFGKFVNSNEKTRTRYGDIPRDWQFVHIEQVANQVSVRNIDTSNYPVLSCTKYEGFVDSLKYFKKKVFSDDTSTYKVLARNTFAFPSNHIEEGSIGYQDLYDFGLVSPIYTAFKTNRTVHDGYLYKLLKTEHYRQIFSAQTNASVDRRGSLRWNEFKKIQVPLPSFEEQETISNAIDASDNEMKNYQQQLENLQQQKTALMQQLLTGKRRVKMEDTH